MPSSLGELENLLGYRFGDISMLERAVTHRSWAYENTEPENEEEARAAQNETLEFVGDSVLGLVIAEKLYLQNPDRTEGDLTLMKHRLVSADTLASVARDLELGKYLRLGKGEEKSGGRNRKTVLANSLEAIIGAVFFDGGYVAARSTVNRFFSGLLREVTPSASLDFKTLLQETLQARKRKAPIYNVTRTEGPSHQRKFWVEAVWEGGRAEGRGDSIKAAEMEAAEAALDILRCGDEEQS